MRVLAVALSFACLAIDYETGPVIEFPVVYLAPISIASWFGGRTWGLALAVILPLCRLYFRTIWNPRWSFLESSINAAIRMTVFVSFAWLIDRTARQMRELKHTRLLGGDAGCLQRLQADPRSTLGCVAAARCLSRGAPRGFSARRLPRLRRADPRSGVRPAATGRHPNLAFANTTGLSTSSGLRALNASACWTPTRLPIYRSSALYLSRSVAWSPPKTDS